MSKVKPELKTLALEIVKETRLPTSIEDVARKLGVAWGTARALLLELAVEGKVSAQKTTKSWIFSTNTIRSVLNENRETN